MQKIILIVLLFSMISTFGQRSVAKSKILSKDKIDSLFTHSLKKQLGINYPIRKAYKCTDNSGDSFILLTESNDTIAEDKDTLHYNIKAFKFRQNTDGLSKKWVITDFITPQATNGEMESSIWFWTKYSEFADIDNDGLIDPIIIYGTRGMNGIDNGRIKLLIYYKDLKIAIRHQNGVLDSERNTRVDKAFYSIPRALQEHIKLKMTEITDDNNAIFPYGWQTAMKNKKIYFDENN